MNQKDNSEIKKFIETTISENGLWSKNYYHIPDGASHDEEKEFHRIVNERSGYEYTLQCMEQFAKEVLNASGIPTTPHMIYRDNNGEWHELPLTPVSNKEIEEKYGKGKKGLVKNLLDEDTYSMEYLAADLLYSLYFLKDRIKKNDIANTVIFAMKCQSLYTTAGIRCAWEGDVLVKKKQRDGSKRQKQIAKEEKTKIILEEYEALSENEKSSSVLKIIQGKLLKRNLKVSIPTISRRLKDGGINL